MKSTKLAFIGGGNMATAIFQGLLTVGFNGKDIFVSEPYEPRRLFLKENYEQIVLCVSNREAIKAADVVLLCVKPQVLKDVVLEVNEYLRGKLLISIVAGISAETICSWVGNGAKLVRVMPNLCALEGVGASGLFAVNTSEEEKKLVAELLKSTCPILEWVNSDQLIDAVTAVSGSGPAYFFLFISALTEAGVKVGLSEKVAMQLAMQTAYGASVVAQKQAEKGTNLTTLKEQVTSKGGTTAAALSVFEKENVLKKLVAEGVEAAFKRSKELSLECGK